ncbi:MAG: T9SS C-terminal target domain-containing protein [Calditrichaeota bacterium]|nr:MAG: T9SS C-terminal target domain-containing protein [Calditrichota bacterium]
MSDYLSLPAWKNWLVVTTPFPNFNIVGVFRADLRGLDGQAAVVFASGFLNPSANQNGEGFAILAALPDGSVAELPKLFGEEASQVLAQVAEGSPDAIMGLTPAQTVTSFEMMQNYPNPFNPTTRISFSVPVREQVTLKVYDITGQEVSTLVNDIKEAGTYSIEFNAANLPTGVYFYRIDAGSFTQIRKMMLVK